MRFSLAETILTNPLGLGETRNSGAGIRTPTKGTKILCATVTPPPNRLIYIIVFSPSPINPLSGTLSLGAAVHSSNLAILPVARRDFPLLADFEGNSIVAVAAGHNSTAVEGNNTVVVEGNSKVVVEMVVDS